jgi:hypothetical protein
MKAMIMDICLPDYWLGSDLPWCVVLVSPHTDTRAFPEWVCEEIDADFVRNAPEDDEAWIQRAKDAAQEIDVPPYYEFFPNGDEGGKAEPAYAYVVFKE